MLLLQEKVQRHAAQYVKGIYTYNASVMQIFNELATVGITWIAYIEQFHLVICCIKSLSRMFISHQNIYLIFAQRHVSIYQLQTRYCHVFRLSEPYCHTNVYKYSLICVMFIKIMELFTLSNCWDYTTALSFKSLLRDHYIALNS